MAMRTDCRHYESRTYGSGEVVHKCRLDLAPEAPWRCPDDCPRFELRRIDVGWTYGSLTPTGPVSDPSGRASSNDDVAALLNAAEDIVNQAAPEILAEHRARTEKGRFRRKKRR
jgi:hypothetical protein